MGRLWRLGWSQCFTVFPAHAGIHLGQFQLGKWIYLIEPKRANRHFRFAVQIGLQSAVRGTCFGDSGSLANHHRPRRPLSFRVKGVASGNISCAIITEIIRGRRPFRNGLRAARVKRIRVRIKGVIA